MESPRTAELIREIRKQCLRKGQGGIKQLGVIFRAMDVDFSKRLCFEEFRRGIRMFGIKVTDKDLKILFDTFDKDKNNHVDFSELVSKLRPPMPKVRTDVVNEAFNALDVIKDNEIKMDDLKIVYASNARRHPKYLSGEWTEEETLRSFLDSIDTPGCPDGKVTREEFMNYYSGVSSTVDDDCYFDLMMRACYGLPNKGMYMVVDNGEKILLDVEEGRLQLQRQILSVLEKLYLLWDVVRKSLGLMIPILAGTTINMMANNCLPSPIAFPVSSLVLGMIIGLIFITLGPLNEAIATFLEHKMFVPDILPCEQLKNLGEDACQWEHVDDDMVPPPSPSQVKEPTLD